MQQQTWIINLQKWGPKPKTPKPFLFVTMIDDVDGYMLGISASTVGVDGLLMVCWWFVDGEWVCDESTGWVSFASFCHSHIWFTWWWVKRCCYRESQRNSDVTTRGFHGFWSTGTGQQSRLKGGSGRHVWPLQVGKSTKLITWECWNLLDEKNQIGKK